MKTMKTIQEIITKNQATVEGNKVYFSFDEDVTNDNGETITLPDAINIEKDMMNAGCNGALIGGIFDESDMSTIYFELPS